MNAQPVGRCRSGGRQIAWARLLRCAHEVTLSGRGTPAVPRDVIVQSWARCVAAGVNPERPAPRMLGKEETEQRLAAHPLAAVVPIVRDLFTEIAEDARHLAVLGDADGLLLWVEGHSSMVEAAAKTPYSNWGPWTCRRGEHERRATTRQLPLRRAVGKRWAVAISLLVRRFPTLWVSRRGDPSRHWWKSSGAGARRASFSLVGTPRVAAGWPRRRWLPRLVRRTTRTLSGGVDAARSAFRLLDGPRPQRSGGTAARR